MQKDGVIKHLANSVSKMLYFNYIGLIMKTSIKR